MEKIKTFFSSAFTKVKGWLKSNGIVGLTGLVLGLVMLVIKWNVSAGFFFGVFASKNFDMIKSLFAGKK